MHETQIFQLIYVDIFWIHNEFQTSTPIFRFWWHWKNSCNIWYIDNSCLHHTVRIVIANRPSKLNAAGFFRYGRQFWSQWHPHWNLCSKFIFDTSDMNVSNFNSTISKRMRVTNFGQRSNILNNKSCTGAQEVPSVQYQGPIRTALRNTWRPIRTVTFVEPLPFLRRFHRRECGGSRA